MCVCVCIVDIHLLAVPGYTNVAHLKFSDDHTVVQLGGNPVYTDGELVGVVRHTAKVLQEVSARLMHVH